MLYDPYLVTSLYADLWCWFSLVKLIYILLCYYYYYCLHLILISSFINKWQTKQC